jgi:t-SNARE complex subunit (syntaxin)
MMRRENVTRIISFIEQDAALDTLMDSVQRQKEIAKDIQKEVDEQAPLLDDIEAGLNKVEGRLKNTTQRVEQIRIKSSTKGMWCIICLLIIALVIVIILAKEL